MSNDYSLEELAGAVQKWCQEHRVLPLNGQAAEQISERNIRYYRTLGLLDAPAGNYTRRFTDKHRLQLIAIRIYQAQGFPLRRIRDELYGKSLEDLQVLEKQAAKRGKKQASFSVPLDLPVAAESWSVVPLAADFLLVSRQNQPLPRAVIEKINNLLKGACLETETATQTSNN